MGRQRSPNRDKAFEVYKKHDGKITSVEISKLLDEKLNNINSWRVQDKWKKKLNGIGPGAPVGNCNAVGNKGGAPKKNINSFKYGKYTERIPMAVKNIMQELDIEDPLEKLWRSICLQEAQLIHMQDIMHVRDKDDFTKDIKKLTKGKNPSIEYEIQFAWDKEEKFMNTLSRSMTTLSKMIKQYDEMIHADWDTVTEEQKLRVERVRVQLDNPELKHRIEHDKKKIEIERERFEYKKELDERENW